MKEENENKWHPKLTQEQIDELEAEGIKPGDNEYTMALWNYGINPNEPEQEEKPKMQWHPKLTEEQIDYAISKGIYEPVGPEYEQFLGELGIRDIPDKTTEPTKEPEPGKKPEPAKEPEPGKEPEPAKEPEPPKKGDNPTGMENLPIRSFWEIYDSTNTEHCGTIARLIHKMAKAPLFRMKGEDTVQKALSFIPNVLTFIPKLIAKPINYVLRTDRKFEEMYENVYNLSPEEFAVLTESAENAIGVKNPRDKDYISSAAKQYKINDLYLDAVNAVYKKRQQERIDAINGRIAGYDARIRELRSKQEQEPLTIDEQVELAVLGLEKDGDEQWGDKIAIKVKAMEQAAREKSSGYRNISGWFLGRFNPDNRQFNHRMAELAKQRREAWERGEQDEATIITQEMDDLALAETDIRTVGTNPANTIDRGNTSIRKGSPCEILDRGQSTKTRLLIANLAVGAAALKTAQMIHNQGIIDAQKAEIVDVNAQNAELSRNGAQSGIDQQLVEDAAREYTHKNIASAHATGEYANLDARAMEHGGSWTRGLNSQEYRANDDLLHAATTDVHTQVEGASMIDGVKASADYYSKVASEAIKAHQSYYPSHDFDYTGYMGSLEQAANSQAMVKLFETLQNTISASPAKFTPVQDLLGGISNSADYALLALIGAGVLKDAMDRDYARPTSAPKPRENKKDDRENDENEGNTQGEQTNETNDRDGEDR